MRAKLKWLAVGWGLTFVSVSSVGFENTESIYEAMKKKAYNKALGLTRIYFGSDAELIEFSPSVSGSYRLIVSKNGQENEMYLLSDLQNIIEGRLHSPLIRNVESAHGIKFLEGQARKNTRIDSVEGLFYETANQVTPPITGKTAASLLEGEFQDYSNQNAITEMLHVPTPDRSTNELSQSMYDKITSLQNASSGSATKEIYLFVDLNCPACMKVEPRLIPYVKKGMVNINYIPVGFLPDRYQRNNPDITDSEAKAMYALIPAQNEDRLAVLHSLLSPRPVDELIDTEAPQELRNIGYNHLKNNNFVFFSLPQSVTPLAVYLQNGVPRYTGFSEDSTRPKKLEALINSLDKIDS